MRSFWNVVETSATFCAVTDSESFIAFIFRGPCQDRLRSVRVDQSGAKKPTCGTPKVFLHAGLLVNEPPKLTGLLFIVVRTLPIRVRVATLKVYVGLQLSSLYDNYKAIKSANTMALLTSLRNGCTERLRTTLSSPSAAHPNQAASTERRPKRALLKLVLVRPGSAGCRSKKRSLRRIAQCQSSFTKVVVVAADIGRQ